MNARSIGDMASFASGATAVWTSARLITLVVLSAGRWGHTALSSIATKVFGGGIAARRASIGSAQDRICVRWIG
jgi:hypothetical protein